MGGRVKIEFQREGMRWTERGDPLREGKGGVCVWGGPGGETMEDPVWTGSLGKKCCQKERTLTSQGKMKGRRHGATRELQVRGGKILNDPTFRVRIRCSPSPGKKKKEKFARDEASPHWKGGNARSRDWSYVRG